MDREAWRAAIHGVAKSQTGLSNWTQTMQIILGIVNKIGVFHLLQHWWEAGSDEHQTRWRNSRKDLYWALSPLGQSWSHPGTENFNNTSVFLMNLSPKANVGFSTSIPRPSNNSMVTYLIKITSTIFFSFGLGFLIWFLFLIWTSGLFIWLMCTK